MHNDAGEIRDLAGVMVSGYEQEMQRLGKRVEEAEELAAWLLLELEETPCFEGCVSTTEVLQKAVGEVASLPPGRLNGSIYLAAVRAYLDAKEGKG